MVNTLLGPFSYLVHFHLVWDIIVATVFLWTDPICTSQTECLYKKLLWVTTRSVFHSGLNKNKQSITRNNDNQNFYRCRLKNHLKQRKLKCYGLGFVTPVNVYNPETNFLNSFRATRLLVINCLSRFPAVLPRNFVCGYPLSFPLWVYKYIMPFFFITVRAHSTKIHRLISHAIVLLLRKYIKCRKTAKIHYFFLRTVFDSNTGLGCMQPWYDSRTNIKRMVAV